MMAATTANSTVCQLSCFSSIHRYLHRRPSLLCLPPRTKLWIVMSVEGQGTESTSSETRTGPSYAVDDLKPYREELKKPYSSGDVFKDQESNDALKVYGTAKIHDFCFGIPYGGLILTSGLFGFIFSRNPTTLKTGVLYGGALLALSVFSLKIWRQGKSSIPFVLGQAVLSAALCWKNVKTYTMTKRLFPTAFYGIISAGMLFFYLHVLLSGGNPPPKKLHSSASATSQ